MDKPAFKPACARSEDLVGYLYGETSEIEARGFERHLTECGLCRQELSALRITREPLRAIHDEAADAFRPLALHPFSPSDAPARSALRAFREFFRLSPLWLRAGAVTASLVFCVLAALAVFNSELRVGTARIALRSTTDPVVIERPIERVVKENGTYTQAEVDRLISERLREELAERSAPAREVEAGTNVRAAQKRERMGREARPAMVARGGEAPRPAAPSRQLPVMLQTEDDDLPRLSDLLSEVK